MQDEGKLKEYLAGLKVGVDAQRKHRKAITEFLAMLEGMRKVAPESVDYEVYEDRQIAQGKTQGTARDNANKARKYFEWLCQACNSCPERGSVSEECASKSKQRFSLGLPPSLREQLELLAMYDECSITEIIIECCKKGIADRAGDIEYILKFRRGLDERKANQEGNI